MARRRRLAEIELTGVRAGLRSVAFGLTAALAALAAFGHLLTAHRLEEEAEYPGMVDDGGPAPLIVLVAVIGVWLVGRRRRHGAGYVLGLASAAGAIGALIPVLPTPMFSRLTNGLGEVLFGIGILGLFFGGAGLLVLEPILYLGQRRQLERDVDPQFPTARVVS